MKTRTNDDWPIPIPTIIELPLYALVGFTGRCGRRIQPALLHGCPNMPRERVAAFEQAITLAEIAAARHRSLPEDVNLVADSAVANDDAISTAHETRRSMRSLEDVGRAALMITAVNVAAQAADAVAAAHAGDHRAAANAASLCANMAGGIMSPTPKRDALINAMLDDIDVLKERHAQGTLTETTPVAPEFFGPLWIKGPPPGWPSLTE